MWWWGRLPFQEFDDLPDKTRCGVNLLLAGVAMLVVQYGWPRVALGSFQRASAFFFLHCASREPTPDDLRI
jgi:hypothetical protein